MTFNLNLDVLKKPNIQQHNPLLPNEHLRCLMTGVSGSGKTQRLFNMLLEPNFLDYNHLILFTPTVNQTVYHLITEGFNNGLGKEDIIYMIENIQDFKENPRSKGLTNEELDNMIHSVIEAKEETLDKLPVKEKENLLFENARKTITVDYYSPNSLNENPLPRCEALDHQLKHVLIADDCMNRKEMQPVIADYFTNSRHANCSSFYLNQKYTNKDTIIRDNANMILLFKTATTPIKTLYTDNVQSDLGLDEFLNAVNRVFRTPYNFITIDKTASDLDKKFREGLNKPLVSSVNISDNISNGIGQITSKLKKTKLDK